MRNFNIFCWIACLQRWKLIYSCCYCYCVKSYKTSNTTRWAYHLLRCSCIFRELYIILQVASSIQRLMGDLITLWNSPDTDSVQSSLSCCKVLSHCMPLLHQYCDVVEYYLVQNLASNRTTAKLLSVLLGIFTELASKVWIVIGKVWWISRGFLLFDR